MARIRLTENTVAETDPPAGQVSVFAKSDSDLYIRRSDSTEEKLLTLSGGSGAFVATDGSSAMTGHLDMGNQDIDNADLINAVSGLKSESGTYKGEYDSQQVKLTDTAILRSHLSLGRLDLWDALGTGQATIRTQTGVTYVDTSGDLQFSPVGQISFGNRKLKSILAGTLTNEAVSIGQLAQTGIRFVSTNGSDATGTGSVALPYQTIAAAISGAPAGTTIFLYPGTYSEPLITLPSNIKIQGYGSTVTTVPNGFTCTPTGLDVYIDFSGVNFGSLYIDSASVLNGLVSFQRAFGTLLRQDTNASVLCQATETTLNGGTIVGGTNVFNECLIILSPTIQSGTTVFENSKFVARVEAEGSTVVRMLDCELFGASEFINGTIVGGFTPTWQVDLSTDYLGGSTGAVNKTLLAMVPAASTTGFAAVATSGSYVDLSSTPMSSTGQMSTSLETAVVALTDAATINIDASLGNTFTVTLGGNRTLAAPTNPSSGQKVILRITQDATGGRALSFNAAWNFGADLAGLSLSTAANATDYIGAIYNASSSKWDVLSLVRGY